MTASPLLCRPYPIRLLPCSSKIILACFISDCDSCSCAPTSVLLIHLFAVTFLARLVQAPESHEVSPSHQGLGHRRLARASFCVSYSSVPTIIRGLATNACVSGDEGLMNRKDWQTKKPVHSEGRRFPDRLVPFASTTILAARTNTSVSGRDGTNRDKLASANALRRMVRAEALPYGERSCTFSYSRRA